MAKRAAFEAPGASDQVVSANAYFHQMQAEYNIANDSRMHDAADLIILRSEMDNAISERDNAISERDNAISERDNAISERDNAISERDNAINERDSAISERDTLARNIAELEGTELLNQYNELVDLHNQTVCDYSDLCGYRDDLRVEITALHNQRDNAISERDIARSQCMDLLKRMDEFSKRISSAQYELTLLHEKRNSAQAELDNIRADKAQAAELYVSTYRASASSSTSSNCLVVKLRANNVAVRTQMAQYADENVKLCHYMDFLEQQNAMLLSENKLLSSANEELRSKRRTRTARRRMVS